MSRRRIVLLGAGFSANWGGFLGKELGTRLHGQMKGALAQYKNAFLRFDNYEDAWASVLKQATPETIGFIEDGFERMLVTVLEKQEMTLQKRFLQEASGRMAEKWFKDLATYQTKGSFLLVSTNQDSLTERMRTNGWQVSIPGIALPRYQTNELGQIENYTQKIPDEFVVPNFGGRSNISYLLKVHGSFDWSYRERRVLITGRKKAKDIKAFPYLQQSLDWLAQWLKEEPADLIILGHAMADEHVTTLFEEACTDDWNVFVITKEAPSTWMKRCEPSHPRLCQQIKFYLPVPFSSLLDYNNDEYKEYEDQIRRPIMDLPSRIGD